MTSHTVPPSTEQRNPASSRAISGQTLCELVSQIRQMELELASADLPEEKRAALQRTVEEALSILEREQNRKRPQRPSRGISHIGGRIYRRILAIALFLTRVVRFVSSRALSLVGVVFLVYFGLQFFPHPAKWDQWSWIVRLNELPTPVLASIDSALEWPEAVPFYPLGLGFALMVASIVVDNKLTRLCGWLRQKRDGKGKRPRAIQYGAMRPISWLGADPYAAPPLGRAALALRDPHSSW
jgi:hypothetical protein